LNWGILGVAGINQRLIPAFRSSETANLAGIASRSLEKAKAAAAKDGIAKAYGSYDDLLADPAIDAVYIPLPNHLHAEWTKKAADAGKHILCEKPLCPTAAECADLVAYCRAKGVRMMDGFMWPHHPRTAKLKEYLKSGAIGPVTHINAAFTFVLDGLPTANIRMQPEAAGGSLLDVGCYTTYGIRTWMGAEPTHVYATARYVNGVDIAVSGVMKFPGDRTATFDCGFTRPMRQWVEIVGTTGTVRVPDMWIPDDKAVFHTLRPAIEGFGVTVETQETPGFNQMVCMLDHFAEAVHAKRECSPNPDEAVKTGKVMDAILASAKSGREVAV
jgi:predicted dehydrogenase